MTQIDWNKVRDFYLGCRSYKRTAEAFHIAVSCVRSRCYREKWGAFEDSGMQNAHSEYAQSTQNEYPEYATGMQNAYSAHFPGLVLPMLPNAVSQEISFGQPWSAKVIPHNQLADKAAYRAYITNAKTHDCLFSGIRGLNPTARVSRENAPALLVAVVADYDMVMTPAERAKKTAKLSVKRHTRSLGTRKTDSFDAECRHGSRSAKGDNQRTAPWQCLRST